ncbi:DUF4920 domain-containing protein [Halpernia frigidisoli]|uniref:DUF4920 domain-containing protein n=1 Tax=Halpernia frigidisoli TaxID=1125876 RepID=A0A1I3CRX4_9FLAO|nr:DUF4920 domain-containing protein [Halpernia frigidisoli]SFH77019.1 protein of unknown function [Halpernia frigidisoli]
MKKIILTLSLVLGTMIFAQSGPPAGNASLGEIYGSEVSDSALKTAVSATELEERLQKNNKLENVAIKGRVEQVCEMEGCWLTIKTDSKNRFFVKTKDHAFLVPLALRGKNVVLTGNAEMKMTSVKELQHYAEDAKKSKEEIAMITKPKQEVNFMASGIKVVE